MHEPVSNSCLCFDGEEQGAGEVVHVADTRPPVVVSTLTITVSVRYSEPDNGERRPADDERRAEQRHGVPPAHVDQRREDIDKVATTALGHILTGDVVRSVLVNDPARLTRSKAATAIDQRLKHTPVTYRLITASSVAIHAHHPL